MPSTIGKCKLFRIKHITHLEGETFLRNKHEIAFFEIQCTFCGRKENTMRVKKLPCKVSQKMYRSESTLNCKSPGTNAQN